MLLSKLKSEGEAVYLSEIQNGNSIVIDNINFPGLSQNVSYGRTNDGGTPWVIFTEATPLASNEDGQQTFDAALTFSQSDGFYESAFELSIFCTDPDAEIRWTTDGKNPAIDSELYTGPISISETTLHSSESF